MNRVRSPYSWLGVLALLLASPVLAGSGAPVDPADLPEPGEYQASLVTYGPGEVYWQRFGHNAIWLEEPGRGLDHAFNFGYFDFEQENFLLRFVQGRMLYFAAAVPAATEMEFYRQENRSIRVQRLNLDPSEYARLRDHLVQHVSPENRDYLYDYYLDNCSTRLRDALDLALGGELSEQFTPQSAGQTFRDHTRRSTVGGYWYYFALELVLGIPVDRPINRWDEMFLPAELADNLMEVRQKQELPLVGSDKWVFTADVTAVPPTPPEVWYRYLLLSLALVMSAWLVQRKFPPQLTEVFSLTWVLIAGTMGLLMLADWLWTNHQAANPNLNLLLFNPVWLLALVPALRRPMAMLALVFSFAAIIVLFIPGLQYTRDVVALLLPLNVAAAVNLLVARRETLSPL